MSSIGSLLSSSSSATSASAALSVSNILASLYGSSTAAIDVSAAVAAGVYSARAPERNWEASITDLSSQSSDITKIESATSSFLTDLENLNSISGVFKTRTVTSSNSNYVTGVASKGADTGTYSVEVDQLATRETWYSAAQSSASSTLPTSSFKLTDSSGSTHSFSTGSGTSGDTLTDLAASINSASLGVKASVISDTDGARLAISSNSSGTTNSFSATMADYTGTSWTSETMSASSTLGAGDTFTVTGSGASGPSVSVTTYSGETYEELASAINSAISSYNSSASTSGSSTINVTATSGSGSSGTYFSLTSTGSSSFTVNQPAFEMSESVAAQNASVKVDGVPISCASNSVTGAISGVTLYLFDSYSGAEFNLTVNSDVDSMSSAITQFVSDYNTVINLVSAEFAVSSSTDSSGSTTVSQGPLAQDTTLFNFQSAMQNLLNYVSSSTSDSSSGSVTMLSGLGVTVNDDGTLSVDSSTLSDVLTNSTSAVDSFFEGDALNGFAAQSYSSLYSFFSPSNGAFVVDLQSISSQSSDLESQIETFESGYISNQTAYLTNQYTQAEEALQSLSTTMKQYNALLSSSS